jgi:hypothetical protein
MSSGPGFAHLVEIILARARELGIDTNAVKRRLRFG